MSQPAVEVSTRMLYKRLLRAIQRYPSVKRESLLQDVRDEFKQNMRERDQQKINSMRSAAIESLRQLQQYESMSDSQNTWELQLTGGSKPSPGEVQ